MAKTLIETIQGSLQGPQVQAPEADQTSKIQKVLRTKSGRATGTGTVPQQSNMQERMAGQQAKLGGQALQQQGKVAAAQLGEQSADINQRQQQQEMTFQESQKFMAEKFDRESFNILDEYAMGKRKIATGRDVARLEQAGFLLRLNSEKYIQEAELRGAKARLDSMHEFKKNTAQEAFADEMDLFKDDINFDRMTDMTAREVEIENANMDINYAIEIANAKASDKQKQAIAGLASQAIEVGISYAAEEGFFNSSTDTPTPTMEENIANQSLVDRGDSGFTKFMDKKESKVSSNLLDSKEWDF